MPDQRITTAGEVTGSGEYRDVYVDDSVAGSFRITDGKLKVSLYIPTDPEDSIMEFQFELPEDEAEQ